jgi:hypothetical protein
MGKIALVVLTIILIIAPVLKLSANEGMWTLEGIGKLPFDSLKTLGCQLTALQIYNPAGGGIADAAVSVSGSSGSFISPDGLILTNHHVAYDAIQRASTTEHNYLENGFYAKTKADEIPAIGYDIRIVLGFEDITKDILGSVNNKMTDTQRYKAIEIATNKIIARYEKGKDIKCEIASFFGGSQYIMTKYFKIRDVRIVFAPPRSIGDYGGEIDNWMWPRHAGDFTILRAYVGPNGKSADYNEKNAPYKSPTYLKISTEGIRENDFMMVIGFPATTNRYDVSYLIDKMINFDYPHEVKSRRDVINILEEAAAEDSVNAIMLSAKIKNLYNFLKKDQGMMDGFKQSNLLQYKIDQETQLKTFINSNPEMKKKYGGIFPSFDSLYQQQKKWREKEEIIDNWRWRSDFLGFAAIIYKWAVQHEKKDIERESWYQDRDSLEHIQAFRDAQVSLVPSADKEIFIYYLKKALQLPAEQRITAVDKALNGKDEIAIRAFVDKLYSNTRLGSIEGRLKAFRMTRAELDKSDDPFIIFARAFQVDREDIKAKNDAMDGALNKLNSGLIAAYKAWQNGQFYADANGTIRFSYGTVRGYKPRDAIYCDYYTTLAGIIEKNTGEEPFDAPQELVDAYNKKDFGSHWVKSIGDIPVDYLSDIETTNGNSGSPVMNGKGELVGLAFDGNYESMTCDYKFEPKITRTISVDIRYILFLLDKVYHADALLKEMTIQ